MKRFLLVLFFIVSVAEMVCGQTSSLDPTTIYRAVIVDGDTLPKVYLEEIRAYGRRRFKNKREYVRYTKLIYNVKKALPYARIASVEISKIQQALDTMTNEKEKERYLESKEKDLFRQFEQPLRHLTRAQGRILIKLIDREAGVTTYDIVKKFKGRFSAFFWQGVARLFGANLKSEYDKYKDAEIENIVILIDEGKI
ncbi:MAG: DUF4294 domain-containing protein [Marinilabiliaceae bacterium]|nr:DUF4294 domain-containing protein [Marinilabiliaceae bacterium]